MKLRIGSLSSVRAKDSFSVSSVASTTKPSSFGRRVLKRKSVCKKFTPGMQAIAEKRIPTVTPRTMSRRKRHEKAHSRQASFTGASTTWHFRKDAMPSAASSIQRRQIYL
eukprot:Skav228810  [mRNA]  locus=scaffold359:251138:256238:- [translate_table: standard]